MFSGLMQTKRRTLFYYAILIVLKICGKLINIDIDPSMK